LSVVSGQWSVVSGQLSVVSEQVPIVIAGAAKQSIFPATAIISADDFGLTVSVNEAVERAHLHGVLSQASLMVAAQAAADAAARAKQLPGLNVGLHLVVVDGHSILGHAKLPHITQPDGTFSRNQFALGLLYFFSTAARRELAAEIRAQFTAYAATGLVLHHANAHKHMQLHPTVAKLMIRIGKDFGLTRTRVPAEPPAVLRACGAKPRLADYALYAWSFLLRAQTRRAGITAPDHVFGIHWSGRMTVEKLTALLENLPPGASEIYMHPATNRDATLTRLMPDYQHEAEFQALLSYLRE
jgi:hopanoid biosynthesis associated protein HpnK